MIRWLEEPVSMSRSELWDRVRAYYEDQGPEAWATAEVPTQATTNCHIAHAYAATILEWAESLSLPAGETVFVLELGAGTGRLGARVAMALQRQRISSSPEIVVVITDLSRKNIDACRHHPSMQPLIEAGAVDFGRMDVEEPNLPTLELRGGEIPATSPVCLVANYVVDSVRQDVFRFGEGVGHELLVRAGIPDGAGIDEAQLDVRAVPLAPDHYQDSVLDPLLGIYTSEIEEGDVFVPVRLLRTLRALTLDRELLFLCADKSVRHVHEWEGQPPGLVAHGSLSVTANMHAIAHLFEALGGVAWHSDSADTRFTISACITGGRPEVRERVGRAYGRWLNDFGPADFERLGDQMPAPEGLSLELMLTLIRLSHYDPSTFAVLADALPDRVDEATDAEREDLEDALKKVWAHRYRIDDQECLPFHLARTYMELESYDLALELFETSLREDGPDFAVHYNLGLCLMALDRNADAEVHLRAALDFEPDDEEVYVRLAEIADTSG